MKKMPKEFKALAAWLASCGDAEYDRHPMLLDRVFESVSVAKRFLDMPPNANDRYRRMSAEDKLAFRVDACRKYEAETGGRNIKAFAGKIGVPVGTMRRWFLLWRAGGPQALRADYSGAGRKKNG